MKGHKVIALNIIILFLISFLIGLFMYGTNVFIYRTLLTQKNILFSMAEDFTGCKIEYSSIRPSLNAVIVQQVCLINKENHNAIRLGTIQVNLSVFSWLKNRNSPLNLLTGINIKNLHLDTSIEKLKTLKLPQQSSKSEKKLPDISNILFSFSKSSLKLKLENNQEVQLILDSLRVNFFHNKANIKGNLFLEYATNVKTLASTQISYTGELLFSPHFQIIMPEIFFSKTQIGGITLKNQAFKLKYELPLLFSLERLKDQCPIEFLLNGNNDDINLGLSFNNISLDNLIYTKDLKSSESVQKLLKSLANITLLSQVDFDIKTKKFTANSSGNFKYKALPLFNDCDFDFDFSLNNEALSINNFAFSSVDKSNEQKITASGNFDFAKMEPNFNIDINKINLLTTQISTTLQLKKENNQYALFSSNVLMNKRNIPPCKYLFSLNKKNGKIQPVIETVTPFNGISISSEYDQKHDTSLYCFNIKNMSPAAFFDSNFTENMTINSNFKLQLYNKNVVIHEGFFDAQNNSKSLLNFAFDFTNGIFDLNKISLKEKSISGKLRGQLPAMFGSAKDRFSLTFYQPDKNFSLPITVFNKDNELSVSYANNEIASFDKKSKSLNVWITSMSLPFNVRESTPKLSVKVNGNFEKNPQINGQIDISDINVFHDKNGSICGKFSFKDKLLSVNKLEYKDSSNKITGIASGNFNQDMQFDMLLTDDAKKESYTVNCHLANKQINGKAFVTNMELKKLLGKDYKGVLNLRLGIKNNLLSPDISLEAEINNGIYKNSMPIKAFVIGKKQANKVQINTLDFQRGRLKCDLSNSYFYLDGKKIRNINIGGNFSTQFMARRIKSSFAISGNINSPQEILCNLDLHNNSISYLRSSNVVRQDKLDDIKLRIVQRNNRTTIDSIGKKALEMQIMKDSIVAQVFNDNQKIAYINLNKDENKKINGNINFIHFPIEPICTVTLPIVELSEGKLNGQFSLSGTIDDPQFSGEVALYQGKVKIPDYLPRPIVAASGIVRGNGKKLSVVNVCGMCGDGLVTGYGDILFSKNKFDRYRFVVSSDTVPAHFAMSIINVEGKGSLNSFIFEGAPKNFIFDGDIVVEQANIDINTNQLGTSKKKKAKIGLPIDVSLKFTSGKKVTVNYPLINATLAENNNIALQYSDIDKTLGLEGDIKLKNGKINYLNRTFKIEDASVNFDGTGFNPLINLTSYFSTRDKDKNNVKVYLSMNDRLLSFKTRFYSFPQLSENELNQLLGLPATQTLDNENDFARTTNDLESIQNTTNYLGNTFLFSPLENIARRGLNLDTFSLNTEIFGNILSSNTGLIDMLDNSSLSIGKYIFEGFYIESMMTFNKKSDTNDSIFLTLPNANYGFNLQLQVLLELPFVSLGYSVKPRDLTNMTDMEQTISIESGFKF